MESNEFATVIASVPLAILCIGWSEVIIRNLGFDLGPKVEPYLFGGSGFCLIIGLLVLSADAPWYLLVIAFAFILPLARCRGESKKDVSPTKNDSPAEADFVQRRSNTK